MKLYQQDPEYEEEYEALKSELRYHQDAVELLRKSVEEYEVEVSE